MPSSLVLHAATSAQALWVTTRHRCERRLAEASRKESGLTTLEIVVWGAGLFAAALAAVLVVKGAITKRTDEIK